MRKMIMRKILYTLLFLVGYSSTQAQPTKKTLSTEIVKLYFSLGPKTTYAQNGKITDEQIESFSGTICRGALKLRDLVANNAGYFLEDYFLSFLGTSKEDPNYKTIITKFWNEHSEKFICYDPDPHGMYLLKRTPQHFMKRVVDLGMHKTIFYKFLISDPKGYALDFNAIEIYEGKEETIIDYIDSLLNNPDLPEHYNVKEIKNVRSWMIKGYGAKRASELKK